MKSSYSTLLHKLVWTFIQALTGILVAAGLFDWDVAIWQAALGAAVADSLVVVKEFARSQLARHVDS